MSRESWLDRFWSTRLEGLQASFIAWRKTQNSRNIHEHSPLRRGAIVVENRLLVLFRARAWGRSLAHVHFNVSGIRDSDVGGLTQTSAMA